MFDDDQETPNTLNCAFEYSPAGQKRKMIYVRGAALDDQSRGRRSARLDLGGHDGSNSIGNIFYGSKGYLSTGDEDAEATYKVWLGRRAADRSARARRHGSDHYQNFIDCVISRKKEDLNAPIEEGHISCAMMHLANASYRLGRTINFDPEKQEVVGDPEAEKLLRDGDRGYRAPFVVPEKV